MGTHTPGPWRVGADLTAICVDWRDEHGNARRECFTSNGWAKTVAKVTHARFADVSEHVANARLIAAAPELLASCEALLERYRIMVAADGPEAMEAARVIAKARGDQP